MSRQKIIKAVVVVGVIISLGYNALMFKNYVINTAYVNGIQVGFQQAGVAVLNELEMNGQVTVSKQEGEETVQIVLVEKPTEENKQ